jgi:hypothetical protein
MYVLPLILLNCTLFSNDHGSIGTELISQPQKYAYGALIYHWYKCIYHVY